MQDYDSNFFIKSSDSISCCDKVWTVVLAVGTRETGKIQ